MRKTHKKCKRPADASEPRNAQTPASSDAPPPRLARGPLAIGAAIRAATRPLLKTRGLAEGDLIGRWKEIVGPDTAWGSMPERLSFPRRPSSGGKAGEGELLVRAASGPFAVQLQHDAPLVIERINGYFGYKAVARLKIVQAPLPLPLRTFRAPPAQPLDQEEEKSLAEQLTGIEDPELKAALEGLGRALAERRRTLEQEPPSPWNLFKVS